MRLPAALLVATALALPAQAAELPARAEAVLENGRPFVAVTPGPDGASGEILAAIDIAAPVETVWATITDCALAPKMASSLKSCRIVDRDPAGRWDVREHISRGGLIPPVRSVFRSDYDPPREIRFHRTGGELAVYEGEWRLVPHGGEVRVFYETRVAAPFHVPGWLARWGLRMDVPSALLALKREAMARAK
jgi:hypothetical protein